MVAIGDSHTYGWGVSREQAWPALLAREVPGLYSMAFGGYGPVHYQVVSGEAEELNPERFVVGLYAGNDLCEAHFAVYLHGLRPDLVAPELVESFAALDRDKPMTIGWDELQTSLKTRQNPGALRWIRSFAAANIVTYRALSRIKSALRHKNRRPKDGAPTDTSVVSHVSFAGRETDLTPGTRVACLDLDDHRVQRALAVSVEQLTVMHASTPTVVVGLPTKEAVWCTWLAKNPDAPTLPGPVLELCRREARLWKQLDAALSANGIAFRNSTPMLSRVFEQGGNPYFESWDGHPSPAGHAAIAIVAGELLSAQPRSTP